MIFSIFYLVVLLICSLSLTAAEDQDEICSYRDTVDLTNQTRYDNQSYVYQGVLVPPEKQDFYKYHLRFRENKITVPRHLRGCVCSENKNCIKLCCERNQFFNTSSNKCEILPEDFKVLWNMEVRFQNASHKNVNIFEQFVYLVGLPCKRPVPLLEDTHKWNLLENGVLHVENDDSYSDTLDHCFTPYRFNESEDLSLIPQSCAVPNIPSRSMEVNNYAMLISIIFLIPTIMVYLMFKELRGNLRGKLLICYLLSMVIGYAIICLINLSTIVFDKVACNVLGFTCYFFFMSAFLWLSVLCYDMWNHFNEKNSQLNSRKNTKRFIYYSLYAWGWALIFTILVLVANLSPYIDQKYKPGIGTEVCWLDIKKWSAFIYFFGPNLIILIFNFITFAHITVKIYKVRHGMAKMTHREKFFHENAIVILRLFLIMGISWLFDILSYILRNRPNYDFIFKLSDFANAIQGLLIFCLFVLKRNVLNLLKTRFKNIKTVKPRRRATSTTTNSSKISAATQTTMPLVIGETP